MKDEKQIWTIASILQWTEQYFKSKGITSARLDAEVLLANVLKKDRIYLYVHFDEPMEEQELAIFRQYVAKRSKHMPVAYILGHREFMGMSFKVTPATLIPRPDTEILVEAVIEALKKENKLETELNLVDIGTGTGAILISLLTKCPQAKGIAVDISKEAMEVALENADTLGVEQRFQGRIGDLFAPVTEEKFNVIVSNPPYIPEEDMVGLEEDVKSYEPLGALTDGGDGLAFYRRLFNEGQQYLLEGGFMAVEIGINQGQQVKEIAEASSWKNIEVYKDYAGIDRVVMAWKL